MIYPSSLTSRLQLAQLCNNHGLCGRAAEIGTHRGDFATAFLQSWQGQRLYCIDPYLPGSGDDRVDYGDATQRQEDYEHAQGVIRSATHNGQVCEFIKLPSVEAATSRFTEASLDFVYIDGIHTYEAVLTDLRIWWQRLVLGGILAGHDVVCFGEKRVERNWGLNVQAALMDWQLELPEPVDVFIIVENQDLTPIGGSWSYYILKTK